MQGYRPPVPYQSVALNSSVDFQLSCHYKHWPSFGVVFVFMGLVGTFAGMSVSDFISDVYLLLI
jgi:hypothetical protein